MLRSKYRQTVKGLHTDAVRKTISHFQPNRVLGCKPPSIHKSEKSLPRTTCSTLSQLRLGHCARLGDFQFRLGKTPDDICPNCGLSTQNVPHLFDCPTKPTTLTTKDLWENPREVMDFLRSTPTFDNLPALTSPPHRRHPARPPADPPDPIFSPLSLPPSCS